MNSHIAEISEDEDLRTMVELIQRQPSDVLILGLLRCAYKAWGKDALLNELGMARKAIIPIQRGPYQLPE